MNPTGGAHRGDDVAAYLLGSMTDDERQDFEAHLRDCELCREDVAVLRSAADVLPSAAPPLVPPPELKERIMATVLAEARLLEAAGPEADEVPAPRRRTRRLRDRGWLRPAAVGLATAAAVGGLALGFVLRGATDSGEPARTVAAQIADPDLAGVARASLVRDDGAAKLVISNLPNPERGRIYQVWLARPGVSPEPTDSFFTTSRDGSATVEVPGDLGDVPQVLVSSEPVGGSQVPTRQPIIVAPTT